MTLFKYNPYKWLIAAALVLPALLFVVVIWNDYNSILENTRAEVIRTVNVFERHAVNVFETHKLAAQRVDDRLQDMSWSEIEQSTAITDYLHSIESEYPQIGAIWLADASGLVRNASRALPAETVSIADRDYFQALSHNGSDLFIGHIIRPRVISSLNFNVAYRRGGPGRSNLVPGDPSSNFDGVIIVTAIPEYFSGFWNSITSRTDSAAILLRSDGAVLSRSLGLDMNRLFLPADSRPLQAIKSGDNGTYIAASAHDGTRRVFGFQKVDKFNVYVFYGVSLQAVYRTWREHVLLYGMFFGLAVLILFPFVLAAQKNARNMQLARRALQESRSDLDRAQEVGNIGSWRLDIRSNVLTWSDECHRIFGTSAVITQTYQSFLSTLHPDDRLYVERRWKAALEGEPYDIEHRLLVNGQVKWVREKAYLEHDQYGLLIGGFGITQDITERKRVEEALRKAHDELEQRVRERTLELAATVENLEREVVTRKKAESSLLRLNSLYTILSETNQTIVRVSGRDALFSECCRIAVEHGGFILAWVGLLDEKGELQIVAASGKTDCLQDVRLAITKGFNSENPTSTDLRKGTYNICNDLQNDPGSSLWHAKGRAHGFFSSASIALQEQDRVIGALTLYAGVKDFFDMQHTDLLVQIGSDISYALDNFNREDRRQKAEQALQEETRARLKAVEAMREKEQMLIQQSRQAAMGEMIGNIAHQWRQPLNVLGLTIQSLLMTYDHGKFSREFMERSVSKSMGLIMHMSKTIDDFKNYFKPDKEKVAFDVQDVIEDTLSLLEGSFHNPSITVDIDTRAKPVIHGYRNEFSQVLLNILTNARDAFIERKISDPAIIITIDSEDGRAVLTIADNAGGVAEGIIDKIFDPYFTTKGPQLGTGIGLFMSKAIIEKNMGGHLSVRNINNGTEFRIEVGSILHG
jgi:PAS domain S-box-containing protein